MGRFINEKTRGYLKLLAHVSSMGLSMVIATVLGLVAGYYFDKWTGTHPWGFFVGLILGVVAGFRNLYIIAKRSKLL